MLYKRCLGQEWYFGNRPRQVDCEGLSVEEFADIYPYGVYLVRIDGHLTCVIDDGVYDIWDCRDELATNAWIVD